jgi:hypothetical protein
MRDQFHWHFRFLNTSKTMFVAMFAATLYFPGGIATVHEIHEAAKAGDLAKVKGLSAKGADVNAKGESERTTLHCAVE